MCLVYCDDANNPRISVRYFVLYFFFSFYLIIFGACATSQVSIGSGSHRKKEQNDRKELNRNGYLQIYNDKYEKDVNVLVCCSISRTEQIKKKNHSKKKTRIIAAEQHDDDDDEHDLKKIFGCVFVFIHCAQFSFQKYFCFYETEYMSWFKYS